MKKHIVVHILMFPPDQVSTAYLYGDIVQEFVNRGFKVTVVTTTPHYNYEGSIENDLGGSLLWKKTNYYGAEVFHFPHTSSKSFLLRAFNIFFFHIASFIKILFLRKIDVILTPSPPITAGLLSGIIAKIKWAKSIYNVQEIYPDVLINHLQLKFGWLISILKKIEILTYRFNDKIVVIDEMFGLKIKDRLPEQKLLIIPNFVDTNLYKPFTGEIRDDYSFDGKYLVGYVGNLGKVQDWDCVLAAAKILEQKSNIHFLLVGGGSEYTKLTNLVKTASNVTILPYQNRNHVPELNQRIDLHFISMAQSSDYDGLPSKVLTILASGKRIIAATANDTPLAHFLNKIGNSIVVDRGSAELFADAILKQSLVQVSNEDAKHTREIIINHYSKEIICGKYVTLVDSLSINNAKN